MNPLINWPTAPTNLSLYRGSIHVWAWSFDSSDEQLNHYMSLLSLEEQVRAKSFYFRRDFVRYITSHALVRVLLGRYLAQTPKSLEFTKNIFGKPTLRTNSRVFNLNFNLSHTKRLGLWAIANDLKVGVDVEELNPIGTEVADHYFSNKEREDLRSLPHTEWLTGFYNCWTRKEAILKAEGTGLNVRLDSFDVSLCPGQEPALLDYTPSARLTLRWHLIDLRPGPGFAAAIATSAPPQSIDCFKFDN